MAETPVPLLRFEDGCADCGRRWAELPAPLPDAGDDFDWNLRDFDGFRRFMLEELAARFPERARWTPADMEVVLVEALATLLDRLSDMADRVAAEAYLETARRPSSVRKLLEMIGYDAVLLAPAEAGIVPSDPEARQRRRLERFWQDHPHRMEEAKREGPRSIRSQKRMVTVADYALRTEEHPLVLRANSREQWTGSWPTIFITVILWDGKSLDESPELSPKLAGQIEAFHRSRALPLPALAARPSLRAVLRPFLDAFCLAGQEALLEDVTPAGISLSLSILVKENFFQSEVRAASEEALGRGPDGFFAPGNLRFGEDLRAGDIIQTLMDVDGVENVCLGRFKRVGSQFPDEISTGLIRLDGLEIAVCDNIPNEPKRGYFRLKLTGGQKG